MDQKLFSLSFVDASIKKLNVRSFDGDNPSPLEGISLSVCDTNLHQHGMLVVDAGAIIHTMHLHDYVYSHADVDLGTVLASCYWAPYSGR